ncbi:MAG TPA: glycoside hydrolase family 38 C-terminal domain-containing protein [Acidimicrobiales bacterium]|nr:glycoside hydrolase family 38 C-terminal domain-containing protein [Acidimicrobiales bacterium]
MVRQVAVVPHTHWDREWYLPFQAFRLGLVQVLDEFLPVLESDEAFDRFLLDGQMAVVDDYLELRPHAAPLLERLAAAGRLLVGPWYILMDEFLVSGETIIRNLQRGLERAADFGGAMAVGYLPDMFGHIAQMPQLLRQAGFDHAVVWRGVPAAVDRTAFWWRGPDGSTVRAEYLLLGYSSGAAMPARGDDLVRRVDAYLAEFGEFSLAADAPVLWMNGTDHQAPQPWLGATLAEANAGQDRYHFAVSSLPEYLAKAPVDGLDTWDGELRAGARANLLMGVASNRVDVKAAAARTERALERVAEPLCALWLPPEQWPEAELRVAWTEVIRNSAHDSICACSHDMVGAAVRHRFDEAWSIAEGLRRRALRSAGAVMGVTGPVVVNPSARARGGVVELVVPGDGPVAGGQVLESVPAAVVERAGTGAERGRLLGALAAEGFRPDEAGEIGLTVDDTGVELGFVTAPVRRPDLRGAAILAEAEVQAGAHPDRPLRIRAERAGWQRVLVHVPEVPGFGWGAWEPAPLTVPPVNAITGGGLTNGRLSVAVDDTDGTWSITPAGGPPLAGLGRLVDAGDAGDTYNYSPPPDDRVICRPDAVAVEVHEAGPVRGVIRVTRSYRWPDHLAGGSRAGEQPTAVVTDLELRAGEELLRVTTSFDNRSRDHRLRAWFPLPTAADHSQAECAFAVVTRGLSAEGGPQEFGLPTFPSRRFVSAGGLTVLHEGLLEYELVAGGTALALTLLRATGMLSQAAMAYRDNPAGPTIALEGPQMQGPITVRYALHVGDGDPYALADQAWVPLEVVEGAGLVPGPPRGQVLAVAGAEVSALQRVGGRLELRVFNPSPAGTTVTVGDRAGWLVDLRGAPQERVEQSFSLPPWGIATVRLDEP